MARRGWPNPTVPPSGCVFVLASIAALLATALAFASSGEDVAGRIADLLAAGKLGEARALADDAVARQPGDAVLQLLAGVAALRADDEAAAASHLEAAARIDPNLPGLAFQRGALAARRCSRETSERKRTRCFNQAVEFFDAESVRQPNEPKVAAARARALIAADRQHSAASALTDWMRLDPGDAEPLLLLAPRYALDRRWKDLAALPDALRGATPEAKSLVCGEVAAHLYVAARFDEGLPLVLRALAVEPDAVRREGLAAMRAAVEGRPDEAMEHFAEFASRSPDGVHELAMLRAISEILLTFSPDEFEEDHFCAVALPGSECLPGEEMERDYRLPVLKKKADPNLSPATRRRGGGRVTLGVLVTREGLSLPFRVLAVSNPEVLPEAIRSLRQFRYEPGRLRGEIVPFFYTVRFDFQFR